MISATVAFALTCCAYDWDIPEGTLDGEVKDAAIADGRIPDATPDGAIDAAREDAGSDAAIVESCVSSDQCPKGESCDWADDGCGSGREVGRCVSSSTCDDDAGDAVCACNGSVYPSACAARHDGQDVSLNGSCATPTSTWRCGYAFCHNTAFCITRGEVDAGSASYMCSELGGCVLGCSCPGPKATCDGGTCTSGLLSSAVTVTCAE
ncbi:MAG TPA: hypothetical protein VF407_16805 [Polyangiaceae bacterium]